MLYNPTFTFVGRVLCGSTSCISALVLQVGSTEEDVLDPDDDGVCDTSMSPVFTAMAVALRTLSTIFAADTAGKALRLWCQAFR